jgi:CcdB protein
VAQLVIRQFDVFENPNNRLRAQVPFIVSLQSHFLDALRTTVVAPIFRPEALPPEQSVMIPVHFNTEPFVVDVALIANIETRLLRRSLGSLLEFELEIRRAIDRLLTGF